MAVPRILFKRAVYHRQRYAKYIFSSIQTPGLRSVIRHHGDGRGYSGTPGQMTAQPEEEEEKGNTAYSSSSRINSYAATGYKMLDTIATTCAYVVVLG